MKSRGRFNANKWSKHLRDMRDERIKQTPLIVDYVLIHLSELNNKMYRLEYKEFLKRGTFLEGCKAVFKFLFGKGD